MHRAGTWDTMCQGIVHHGLPSLGIGSAGRVAEKTILLDFGKRRVEKSRKDRKDRL